MATITRTRPAWHVHFPTGVALDWAFVAASTWLLVGLHLDGWAHAHRPGLESFFTPWHGILYSGFGLVALLTVGAWLANGRTMPAGYQLTMVGVLVFLAGGVADMFWHTFLGIEVNVEAVLSPTHLALATGLALMVTGPLRASWRHEECATRPMLSALLSAGLLIAVIAFFTQFIQPGGRAWPLAGNEPTGGTFAVAAVAPDFPVFPGGVPSSEIAIILGIAGILLATLLLMSVALALVRRWNDLPFGALTILSVLSALLLAFPRDTYWWPVVALAGGLAGDVLLKVLRAAEGGWRIRAWAFGFPAALWSAYFLTLVVLGGVWWSVHVWTGAIVLAGLTGVALSFAVHPQA